MKDWQKGIPIETLKSVSNVFKASMKPYALGPFSIPNDAEIAKRLAAKKGINGGKHSSGRWAALVRTSERAMALPDFRGEEMGPVDCSVISAFGYTGEASDALTAFMATVEGPFVMEVFEEDAALKKALGDHELTHVSTVVEASSELKGFYSLGNGLRRWRDRAPSEERWTLLGSGLGISQQDRNAVLKEAEAYEIQWAQHYSSYNKRHSWTAFALRGYVPSDPTFIIKPAEMSRQWKEDFSYMLGATPRDTVALDAFPTVKKILKTIPGDKDRVRFMRLAGGGELTRHADITDRDAGIADGKVARLHIPLITTPAVEFHGLDARGLPVKLVMEERGIYYLDQRKPHWVKNNDPETPRIHLVIDVFSSPELRELLKHE